MKHIFRPDMALCGIEDIDVHALKQRGIDCLLIDLDNTLAPWDDRTVTPAVRAFIGELRAVGIRPVIISNNRPERVRDYAEDLGVDYEGKARKPLPFGFLRVMRRLGYKKNQCAMVGDQLMTDVMGGNLAGMTTILVNPFCDVEWGGTKFNRMMERRVMKLWGIRRSEGKE